MPKKTKNEKSTEDTTTKKSTRKKVWKIKENDFMEALFETLQEGGNKDVLQAKVIEKSKSYNPRRSTNNCTMDKLNRLHRKAKELSGKELELAPSGSLSQTQEENWKSKFSQFK